ncbi:hypothetical protein GCM10010464_58120 [Pseudonocardia yunnanensis]
MSDDLWIDRVETHLGEQGASLLLMLKSWHKKSESVRRYSNPLRRSLLRSPACWRLATAATQGEVSQRQGTGW